MPTEEVPPRVRPSLKAAPAIRELYWCDLPRDAQLPEFWKCRPVIIMSFRNTLSGAVTVIPCSTAKQPDNPWAVRLSKTVDGRFGEAWAICDKPMTVAVSRLKLDRRGKLRLSEAEFNPVLARLLEWLPVLPA